jgi:putative SOS response-associated peptidase YedK
MCNLYDHVPADKVPFILQHHELVDAAIADELAGIARGQKSNKSALTYPKYPAPVVIVKDGKLALETMKWGMPGPVFPGKDGKIGRPSFVTNVRNTESRHWTPWLAATNVTVGKDKNQGGRCLVPVASFAEPDQHTSKPVINRWFARPKGDPFFFAGIWREWTGDHGTVKVPDQGKHRLFSFLTTEASADVKPVHSKASPVLLLTSADMKRWLYGTAADALALQKPATAKSLVVLEGQKAA